MNNCANSNEMTKKEVVQLKTKMDIVKLLLEGSCLDEILDTATNDSQRGFLFESIVILLILTKSLNSLEYNEFHSGRIETSRRVERCTEVLNEKIHCGNNLADIIVKDKAYNIIAFSVKYRNGYVETDVGKIAETFAVNNLNDSKIGLVVKDKTVYAEHRYNNNQNVTKIAIDKILKNNLLFDTSDVIIAIDIFQNKFKGLASDEFVNIIDREYINNPRIDLTRMLHQEMFYRYITDYYEKNGNMVGILDNLPRTGKSIIMLLVASWLINVKSFKRVLIFTSACQTIDSFKSALNTFIEFSKITYKEQHEFNDINDTFAGILFCSSQYMKIGDIIKRNFMQNLNIDAFLCDEAHLGSSTSKAKKIQEFCNPRVTLYVSGTADKVYNSHKTDFRLTWNMFDINTVRSLCKDIDRDKNIDVMRQRHGDIFVKLLNDNTLDKDYSKFPTPILLQHQLSHELINKINAYNSLNNSNYGFTCSDVFSLRTIVEAKKIKYISEFAHDSDFIKEILDGIHSNDRMKLTALKRAEDCQKNYNSRIASVANPKMVLIFLPTSCHTNIAKLMKALSCFIKEENIWGNCHIEYSCGTIDSNNYHETFNDHIKSAMLRTKKNKKKYCFFMLGQKGGLGITYPDVDISIFLDNSQCSDSYEQRLHRSGTPADGKTVSINIDFNIQRVLTKQYNSIIKYRKFSNSIQSNSEILKYLFETKLYLFNPDDIKYGMLKESNIDTYFNDAARDIVGKINEERIFDHMECEDDLQDIHFVYGFKSMKIIEIGLNPECPLPGKDKFEIDNPENNKSTVVARNSEEDDPVSSINRVKEIAKTVIPILAILCRRSSKNMIHTMYEHGSFIEDIIMQKFPSLKQVKDLSRILTIMQRVILSNSIIVNDIRELYKNATTESYRQLIQNHFNPSREETQSLAEVSTPIWLVDEIIDTFPDDFWMSLKSILDPCCGKGVFPLALFEKFYNGLAIQYPDRCERCRLIIEKCIYFADISAVNVFITTELLICRIDSLVGAEVARKFKFNKCVHNALTLDLKVTFNRDIFDLIITNLPFNESADASADPHMKPIYQDFVYKLNDHGLNIVFITPSKWFTSSDRTLIKFREFMKKSPVKMIKHFKEDNVFPGVKVKGGVSYFHIDQSYQSDACTFNNTEVNLRDFDIILDPKLHKLIRHMLPFYNNDDISSKLISQGTYVSSSTEQYLTREMLKDTDIQCIVSAAKGHVNYLDVDCINKVKCNNWKVCTQAAAFNKSSGFKDIFIIEPEVIHSRSFVSFNCDSEKESKYLRSYLNSSLVNVLLSARKITHNLANKDVFRFIPMVPLDKTWNDELIYEHFKISQDLQREIHEYSLGISGIHHVLKSPV